MTLITWASPRYVQELTTILATQNRTQGSCVRQRSERDGPLGERPQSLPRAYTKVGCKRCKYCLKVLSLVGGLNSLISLLLKKI